MRLERGQHLVPQRRLLGRLDLRQVEHDRCARPRAAPAWLLHHVQRGVDDRRREAAAVGVAHVAVVEVQPARAEDLGREVELRPPVVDDRPAEETARPARSSRRPRLGDVEEDAVARDRQLRGCAGCRATSSTPGRARPRRRTSSRRRPRAARRRRCGGSLRAARRAARPARCPGSTGAGGRAESRCRGSSRARSRTRIDVPGWCAEIEEGDACGSARGPAPAMRAAISAFRSSSSGASASSASMTPAV